MKEFKSGFSEDLEKMIALKVATHFKEVSYISRAKQFDRFCEEKFPDEAVISETIALEWIRDALNTGSTNNAHSRVAFLKTLGQYQKAMGKSPFIPADRMLSGRHMFVPYIFTDTEMKDLFRAIDEFEGSDPFEPILFSVYFRINYTCGLRPRECRALKRSDVDLNSGEIRIVNTKWNKSRSIVMSDEVLALARKYAAKRDLLFTDSEYFFPKKDGGMYTAARIQRRFTKFFELSRPDIPTELLPAVRVYDLRHRFATAVMNKWLDQKTDLHARLPYLQAYMGHKELGSTAYYIHLLPENLTKSAGIDWKKLNAVVPEVEAWEE